MAGIDKIYGSIEQYDEFKTWLEENKPSAVQYLYPRDIYQTSESRPISNFPEKIDKWLLKNCKIEWVIKRIKEQYNIK